MKVVFLNSFKKDLNNIILVKFKDKVKAVILTEEKSESIWKWLGR